MSNNLIADLIIDGINFKYFDLGENQGVIRVNAETLETNSTAYWEDDILTYDIFNGSFDIVYMDQELIKVYLNESYYAEENFKCYSNAIKNMARYLNKEKLWKLQEKN